MDKYEYRTYLKRLQLTQAEAGRFFGVSVRTAHGWANGCKIPHAVSIALQVMLEADIAPEDFLFEEEF